MLKRLYVKTALFNECLAEKRKLIESIGMKESLKRMSIGLFYVFFMLPLQWLGSVLRFWAFLKWLDRLDTWIESKS